MKQGEKTEMYKLIRLWAQYFYRMIFGNDTLET